MYVSKIIKEIAEKSYQKGETFYWHKNQERRYMFEWDAPCKWLLISIPSKCEQLILFNKEWQKMWNGNKSFTNKQKFSFLYSGYGK